MFAHIRVAGTLRPNILLVRQDMLQEEWKDINSNA